MEQSPTWESNTHSASQEIPRLLRNPKIHYHVHSQETATGTCPEPDAFNSHFSTLFLKDPLWYLSI